MYLLLKLRFSSVGIGDIRLVWLSCLGPLGFLIPKSLKLSCFPIFHAWVYLMKVIPETYRVQ